jgi:RecQ family ATP-dependent DNA helicase
MSYDLMKSTIVSKPKTNTKTKTKTNSNPSPTTSDESNYCLFDDNDEQNDSLMTTRKIKLTSNKIKSSIEKIIVNTDSVNNLETNLVNNLANNLTMITDPILETFAKYYPNKTIKPLQYQIIKSISEKSDTIGILPTGYGKSLCYQLPYYLNPDKVIVVVSPLISLMEDQKSKLEKLNIPVACFHSNIGKKKKQDIKEELLENLISTIDKTDTDTNDDIFIDDEINIKTKTKSKAKATTAKSKANTSAKSSTTEPAKSSTTEPAKSSTTEPAKGMVIFLTPEYLVGCENWIRRLASIGKLSLVAMDEAHCISTWGHDFRPDYQGLYRIKEWVSEYDVPLLALTATATAQVETDIKTFLQLTDPKVFKTSFDRPSLIISVRPKPKEFNALFEILTAYATDFGIIYCKTRDKAEELSEFLKSNDYNADVYHAGLSASDRLLIQEKFANKELNIIVATVAFGMGIDQDVHLVIHWGCPADMESYYQEIGRAGRDGVDSQCIMFYDKDDFRISRYFLKSHTDEAYKRFKDEQISKMERYCLLNQCRRKIILGHFGEVLDKNYTCAKCDNCKNQDKINTVAMDNLMYPIFIVAKTIFLLRCKVGTGKIVLVLRGSKAKNISDLSKVITFGLLKELTEDQIKSIINIMTINGYLKEKTITNGFGTVLETTSKLVTWYGKICSESGTKDTYKLLSKDLLTFDKMFEVLTKDANKLDLNIPIQYNHITNIKFKTTINTMLDEFADEFDI